MACANDAPPLQLPWKNISLTANDNALSRGIAVEIGTPPQFFSLRPGVGGNNIFVFDVIDCGTSSNLSCVTELGGVIDTSNSTTFEKTIQSAWNGTQGTEVDTGGPYVFFNDDLTIGSNGSIPGFPFFTDYSGYANHQAGIGMGQGSSFLKALVESGVAPSPIWSIWTGSRSVDHSIDGMMIVGGYDEGRVGGQFRSYPSRENCAFPAYIANATYDTINGSTPLMTNMYASCCIDPFYNYIELPQIAWENFGVSSGAVYNSTTGYLTYPASNPPLGNMTITLTDGYQTTIPYLELFTQLKYWNSQGEYLVQENSPLVAEVLNFTSTEYAYSLGIPFMTMNYFIANYDEGVYHMAPAIRDDYSDNDQAQTIRTVCTPPPPPPTSTSTYHKPSTPTMPPKSPTPTPAPNHTGAIAGGVVGGVLGLALIIGLLIFIFRRCRKARRAQQASSQDQVVNREMAYSKGPLSATTDTAHTEASELPSPEHPQVNEWLSQHPGDDEHQVRMFATSGPAEMSVNE